LAMSVEAGVAMRMDAGSTPAASIKGCF